MTKQELKREVRDREQAASFVREQWRRCFWMRPFGHIYIGVHHTRSGDFDDPCLFCGHPHYGADHVVQLERAAASAHLYPIADGESKRTVKA